jgi:hypothetical protein
MSMTALAEARISLVSPLVQETAPPASAPSSPRVPALEPQWDRVVAELLRLRQLENDWDGHGALAVEPANIDHALAWVKEMRRWQHALPPSVVVPGTLGEVVLEWRGEAFQLAAEISRPTHVEWLLNIPGQPLKQWETDANCSWIIRSER